MLAFLSTLFVPAGSNISSAQSFHPISETFQVPRTPSENIGWNKNVKVLSAIGQDYRSVGSSAISSYNHALLVELYKNRTGLEEAHANLEKQGYSYTTQRGEHIRTFPTSTPRQLGSWQLSDNSRERYALIIGQQLSESDNQRSGGHFNNAVRTNLSNMETALHDPSTYNLPKEHVKRIDAASISDIWLGIKWLQEQLQLKPGSEALIYYSGHAECVPDTSEKEGDVEGILLGPKLWENQLKEWINEQLNPNLTPEESPRVLMIIDACYAGSFIAKANPNPGNPFRVA